MYACICQRRPLITELYRILYLSGFLNSTQAAILFGPIDLFNIAAMPNYQTVHSDSDLARLIRKAHTAHSEGALAQELYKAILARYPGNFDVLHLLGFLNHQRGRQDQALRFLADALKLNAQSVEALSTTAKYCTHSAAPRKRLQAMPPR